MKKPVIKYPCQWSYKVIGSNKDLIAKSINNKLNNYPIDLTISKQSKSGKYTSFNLSLNVENEKERDEIFNTLKNIESVKFVL